MKIFLELKKTQKKIAEKFKTMPLVKIYFNLIKKKKNYRYNYYRYRYHFLAFFNHFFSNFSLLDPDPHGSTFIFPHGSGFTALLQNICITEYLCSANYGNK